MPVAYFSAVITGGNCSFQRLRKEDVAIGHKFTLHQVAQSGFRDTTKQTPARFLGRRIYCITEVLLDLQAISISENHDLSYKNKVIEK